MQHPRKHPFPPPLLPHLVPPLWPSLLCALCPHLAEAQLQEWHWALVAPLRRQSSCAWLPLMQAQTLARPAASQALVDADVPGYRGCPRPMKTYTMNMRSHPLPEWELEEIQLELSLVVHLLASFAWSKRQTPAYKMRRRPQGRN
eukprot:scaffold188987_cov14-Tisochrysis_lutea.AAC.1